MKFKRQILIPTAATFAAVSAFGAKAQRPNIIFIMTDDHTTQAMSCYGGNLVETPNMDRIASEGLRLDNCYATNALSGPSRACILTGKFGHVNGFVDNAGIFDLSQQTFPKLLQKGGYQTAIIGKWHLISEPQGFDSYSILSGAGQQGDYYDPDFLENGKQIHQRGYVTDIITEKALTFLDTCDRSKPFCLMVHHKAVHRNWMPSPEHIGEFENHVFPEPDNLFDDYRGRGRSAHEQDMSIEKTLQTGADLKMVSREELLSHPKGGLSKAYRRMSPKAQQKWDSVYSRRAERYAEGFSCREELISWKYQQYMQDYLATALSVDESIGEILEYLDKNDLTENTVIIYTSDQGFFLGEHGWFDKRFMYEECQRMPFVVRYPKMIKPQSTSSAICTNIDFAPTFLDLAGIDIPSDIQGRSMLPIFQHRGKTPKDWPQLAYYHYYEYPAVHSVKRHYGIRTPEWKLIHFYNDIDEWELYDLKNDPHEMHNLYDDPKYLEIRENLIKALRETQLKYGDTDPDEKQRVLFHGDARVFGRQK